VILLLAHHRASVFHSVSASTSTAS
jgi:hypothetical protein